MKRLFSWSILIIAFALFLLTACGGGGGGGTLLPRKPAPTPTTAILTLVASVTGTIPANTIITGYDITISLPAGVSVKSTTPPETDTGVVTATGAAAGSSITAVYSAATATMPGKVKILIANGSGFSAGEFSKVNCDIAAGYNPDSSAFSQPTFTAFGFDTSSSSTIDLTKQMSIAATAVIN